MCCARQHLDTEQVKRRNKKKGGREAAGVWGSFLLCGQCRAMEKMGADPWLLLGPQLLLALSIHLPGQFCSPAPPDATNFPVPHLGLALPSPAVTRAIPGEGWESSKGRGQNLITMGLVLVRQLFWEESMLGAAPPHTQTPAVAAAVLPPGITPVSGVLRQGCCMNNAVMRRL